MKVSRENENSLLSLATNDPQPGVKAPVKRKTKAEWRKYWRVRLTELSIQEQNKKQQS